MSNMMPMHDFNLLNFQVSDFIQLSNDQGLALAEQCKTVVDSMIEKLKPYLKDLTFDCEYLAIPGMESEEAKTKVFWIAKLSNGEALYLSESGKLFQTSRYSPDKTEELLTDYYGPWIYAVDFSRVIFKLDKLLEEAKNRTSLIEERMKALKKIADSYT